VSGVTLWRIASDTPAWVAEDATGAGARSTGGRWNRPGTPMIYAAPTIAMAVLETFVHLAQGALPLNRYLVRIEVPRAIWNAAAQALASKLIGWDALPPGKVSIEWGTNWCASNASALAIVPSVIVPEEKNVLINPLHPDAAKIVFRKKRRWIYDQRLSSPQG
jgi:RES domain-containing protein